jgi:hypothetical protein
MNIDKLAKTSYYAPSGCLPVRERQVSFPKNLTDFLAYKLAIIGWYKSQRQLLSPNLLAF